MPTAACKSVYAATPAISAWRRFCVLALLSMISSVWALTYAEEVEEVSDSASIHFRLASPTLDLSIGNNRQELERLSDFMRIHNNADSAFTLSRVRVVGGASPEGSIKINERLSRERAASIFNYFATREAMPDSVATFTFLGRDWIGLRDLVEFDTRVPYRSEVLELLDEVTASQPIAASASNTALARLRALRGGVPYRYLFTNVFPQLRESKLYIEYTRPIHPALDVDTVAVPTVEPVVPVEVQEVEIVEIDPVIQCRPFYMGLKTNLLYDALAIPSIGAEFYVGKNWSVGANWMYGWWDNDSKHRYWRAYGGDINVRRWFGKRAEEKPLTGHHIGLYAGVVTYDFELGGKGYMGGLPHRSLWDRCNYLGGIEYGYSLPVGRRINIDFTIGIGYMGGKYLEYTPKDNHYVWQETKQRHWFGPTKAEISLVWLIGCDNYNRKGGIK